MPENRGSYEVYSHDTMKSAESMKIERNIYFREENTDISPLTAFTLKELQAMREESMAAEQTALDDLSKTAAAWDTQAGQTLLLNKAIEYARIPAVIHSSNEWGVDTVNRDRKSISNMVYKMQYRIQERTVYDREAQKSKVVAWDLDWDVYYNVPGNMRYVRIAGQDKKFADKADMEKYLAGRIKAYSNLFTELSPPIPQEYAKHFHVNGQILPGYTIEGQESPQRTAAALDGGISILVQKLSEKRKEREDMNEPLNIKLSTHDNADGTWLKLPATTEQLNAALARIGAQGNDFIISGFETPIHALQQLPIEAVRSGGIDELNFLAVRLETVEPEKMEKLNAAIEVRIDNGDIRRITESIDNLSYYDFHNDISNHEQLGEYTFMKSGLIQIPDEWAGAVDLERLGELAAASEKGVITEYGYIAPNGEEWKHIAEIPQAYQIEPKFEAPEIDFDAAVATRANAAAIAATPIVLVSDNPRDKMKEITDKLEAGIKGIFDSEKYKTYLNTLSKFHNYSFNNCLLIAMQNPAASHIAGYNDWRDKFKRPVMKGEKGIKIFAPAPFKTKKTVDAVDADGKPKYGKDGKRLKEEKEITVPAFKIVSVFDVSQTDGEPLPELGVSELSGSVDKYKDFFAALEKTSKVPIGFEKITSGAKGYYQLEEKRIAINEGMSDLQNLKTTIHELAHSRLHDIDKNAPKDTPRPDRRTREVEAESIAYAVCAHFGLDTSDYSFGYIATWSGGKELDALKNSLDTIRKEADAIITEVDKHFAEITQSKEQAAERQPEHEKWSEPATPGNAPDNPGAPSDDVKAYLPEQGDMFTIYQLKDGDAMRDLRFEPLERLQQTPDMTNYENLYSAPLDKDMKLKDIFYTFNMDRPEDFKGHSLSVSDVVVMNRDGKETAFYVDSVGFKELPGFLAVKEQSQEKPVDLNAVAAYMQKLNDGLQAVKPNSSVSVGAYNATIKRLEQAKERIADNHPQLKALIENAAQSPDFNTLKERMNTLHTEFTQHYSTAVQNTVDMSGKAEPPTPAATAKQSEPAPAQKPPAQGENVAAIEAKVNAGETINLSDLSDAIKKDKQTAQTAQTSPPGKSPTSKTTQQTPAKSGTRGKGATKAAAQEQQPSIKEQLAAGKKQLAGQKNAPSRTQNKNAEIGG